MTPRDFPNLAKEVLSIFLLSSLVIVVGLVLFALKEGIIQL
jgi:hypothetical protein